MHTDAAVSLDGHRTTIPQNSPFAKLVKEEEEDALARKHTRAPMVQPTADYCRPPMNLLKMGQAAQEDTHVEDEERARLLEQTLDSFSISAKVVKTEHGPAITRFAIELGKGVNVNKLNGISNNLALAMKANGLRIEVPIPGTSYVGIEVPNSKRQMVTLREVLDSPEMRAQTSPTVVAMGKDITGKPVLCDLKKMPHLLIAGATGSGKSVCINTIVQSIMYRATPKQVRLMMVDPKVVELQPYNGIPHLLTPVITDPKKAAAALDWALEEMRDRYNRFERAGVNRIDRYNAVITDDNDYMSEIVIIIDEFYDLMQQCRKNVEATIQSLASLARAAGIYMVIATQRPSVDVITGVIKANIPGRIAFAVSNNTDSRTIIDRIGAEKLLRQGDMLYMPSGNPNPMRVQGCYVSDEESEAIIDFVRDYNDSVYDDRVDEHIANVLHEEEEEAAAKERSRSSRGRDSENWEDDYANDPVGENDLLQKAIALAVESGQTSISLLRRRFSLGHSKAGKLIDTMEQMGIISADEGPKPRRTLITREEWAKRQGEIMDE
ncbi:MAG: DNA translocase FtsK [Clostridia bacterium]|nr:DNA translocase FtsK [Clostridia bacterium]